MWDTLVDKMAPRSKKHKKVSIQDKLREVHIIPRMHDPVYLFDKIVQKPLMVDPHHSVEKPSGVATDGGSIFLSKHYLLTLRKEMENNWSSHYINRVFINTATLPYFIHIILSK